MEATNKQATIEAARVLVAAPIIVALADNYASKPRIAERIRATMKPEYQRVGELVISDAVLKPYTLHLKMSKVPRNYRLEVSIPGGYERSLREKFAIFRTAARAFWSEWRVLNAELAQEIAATDLREQETALFWAPGDMELCFGIGIVGYYEDSSGKKYIAK